MDKFWYLDCWAVCGENKTRLFLSMTHFNSAQNLKKILATHKLEYYGTDADTTHLRGIAFDQNPLVIPGIKEQGLFKVDGQWLYTEGGQAVNKDGLTESVRVIGDDSIKLAKLLDQGDITEDELLQLSRLLFKFNDPTIVFPVLGYICFCLIKPRLKTVAGNRCPLLFFQGSPGTGKTETIRLMKNILASQRSIVNIADSTEASAAVTSSQSNMHPVFYDEWKFAVVSVPKRRMMDQMVLATYGQTSIQRAKSNGTTVHTIFSAPMVLAGEANIESPSIKHRIIELYFSKIKCNDYSKYFIQLSQKSLGGLGKALLMHMLKLSDDQLNAEYLNQKNMVASNITDRFRDNAALLRTGLWLLIDYLSSMNIHTSEFQVGYSIIDEVIEDMVKQAKVTNVDKYLQDMSTMASSGGLVQGHDYDIRDNILRIKIGPVFAKVTRWSKRNGTAEPLTKHSFTQQLADKEYYEGKRTGRIGGIAGNAVHIDLSLVPEYVDVDYFKKKNVIHSSNMAS